MKRTLIFCLTIMMIVLTNCSKDKNEVPTKPTLTIERDVYEYLNTDLTGNFAVSISDNSEWTVETLSTESWFSVVKKDNQVSFAMEENSFLYERVAKIKVVSADKKLSKIVVIKQHGNTPTIILDKTLLKLLNPADNGIVTINSNMQWSLNSNADWLTWEINGKNVKIMATANPLDGERSAVISVNTESSLFNKTITVTQKGTVEFEINTKNVQFTKDGGTFTLDIQTNQNWTYAIVEKTPWYTLLRDGGKLTITAPKNNFMPLTGTINITYGLINVAVSVKQDGIQTGNELDRQVLITLYETMGGTGWTGVKWDITAPLTVDNAATKWSGVTVAAVNGVARVKELKFGGKNLKGPVPSAIGFLSEVTTIDFNNNNQQLTGTIPPSMGNLSNLLNLTFSRCGLTGTIPVEFERLTKLTLLQMHTSKFTGPIPAGVFGKMPNLNSVELKLNNFTGALPADFLNHPKFGSWNVSANTCPQNAGFGFTKCP
jgi:hypothetical protein